MYHNVKTIWRNRRSALRMIRGRCLATTTNHSPEKVGRHSRSPYIIFVGDKFADLKKVNPGLQLPDLSRMLGQMWQTLPVETKESYRHRYQNEKEVFEAKKKAYLDSLTEVEKMNLKQQSEVVKNKKMLRIQRKMKRDLGKPKAANVNPFVLFYQSKALERGDAPIMQYLKGLSEHWKRMAQEDKQPFVDQAKTNSILYRQKLADWERKMISEGHSDLVRRSAFRRLTKNKKVTRLRVIKSAKPSIKEESTSTLKPKKPVAALKKPETTVKKPIAAIKKPIAMSEHKSTTERK